MLRSYAETIGALIKCITLLFGRIAHVVSFYLHSVHTNHHNQTEGTFEHKDLKNRSYMMNDDHHENKK